MKPFVTHEARALPLALANVDTDQIIPARFMKRPRSVGGYGAYLLHDFRFDAAGATRPDFALNDPRYVGAQIVIARANFGCGSSREPAVYALVDYGVRCVIAPSFGDIFAANAIANGVLPATASADDVELLLQSGHVRAGHPVRVDLAEQKIVAGNLSVDFIVAPQWKARLLNGLDDIDMTRAHAGAIEDFVARYQGDNPWTLPRRAPA